MRVTLYLWILFLIVSCAESRIDEMRGTPTEETVLDKIAVNDEKYFAPLHYPEEQGIGFYSDGSLINASEFPEDSNDTVLLFPHRKRHFGTYLNIQLILETARQLRIAYPESERLQIGDISSRRGGPLASHVTHQNGLDTDVVYLRKSRKEQQPKRNYGYERGFVKNGKVIDDFDTERNWFLVSSLVSTGLINRIFIDRTIKKAFCKYARESQQYDISIEILRRLRPWPKHHNHMHISFICPITSPQCDNQIPPPEGSGC
jgi:penicillin-insensitive murein endopeptidase